jgi:hypothetical protein
LPLRITKSHNLLQWINRVTDLLVLVVRKNIDKRLFQICEKFLSRPATETDCSDVLEIEKMARPEMAGLQISRLQPAYPSNISFFSEFKSVNDISHLRTASILVFTSAWNF